MELDVFVPSSMHTFNMKATILLNLKDTYLYFCNETMLAH